MLMAVRNQDPLFAGVSRSMICYRHRERKPKYDADLEKRISSIVEERPSYGTRRVTATIRRSGIVAGRNRIRRHMRNMNPISPVKKIHKKHCCGTAQHHVGYGTHQDIHWRRGMGISHCTPVSLLQHKTGIASCNLLIHVESVRQREIKQF